ncbi:hypothetical protein SLA2020_271850 [Shorea laevis]
MNFVQQEIIKQLRAGQERMLKKMNEKFDAMNKHLKRMLSSNGDHGGHYPGTPQTPTATNHSRHFELHDPMHHVDVASP